MKTAASAMTAKWRRNKIAGANQHQRRINGNEMK
jgi:hypothetical protein